MEGKAEGQNRRKSERIDVAFTLVYSVKKPYSLRISLGLIDDIDALMINLSDLGMAIITKHDIPLGTELYIKFNIIDLCLTGDERWRHMEITGDVVSNIILPDVSNRVSHRIGICFINISSENKIAISDFVKRNMFPH
ncbi:MAG: PilZ domain-containing protein [Candidatus Omnitrophica bacterium]|nr:PilZ domain-containing protein [Candidatus Omnitrophota bacterium]